MKSRNRPRPAEAKWVSFYAGLEDIRDFRRLARYVGTRALLGVFRLLPVAIAVPLGEALGWLGYWVLTRYRKASIKNLEIAFPDASSAWARGVARRAMVELGSGVAFAAGLSRMGMTGIKSRPRVCGVEKLAAAVEGGEGVVIVSGHLGCWELLPAYLAASGLDVFIVAERLAGRWEDDLLRSERSRLGVGQVGEGVSGIRRAVRSLREGAVVVCPFDQDAGRSGYLVPFFGRRAFVPSLPLKLAQLSGVRVLPAYALREGRRHALTFESAVEVRRDQNLAQLAAELAGLLEGWIRKRPEQWPWIHNRWKRGQLSDPGG